MPGKLLPIINIVVNRSFAPVRKNPQNVVYFKSSENVPVRPYGRPALAHVRSKQQPKRVNVFAAETARGGTMAGQPQRDWSNPTIDGGGAKQMHLSFTPPSPTFWTHIF